MGPGRGRGGGGSRGREGRRSGTRGGTRSSTRIRPPLWSARTSGRTRSSSRPTSLGPPWDLDTRGRVGWARSAERSSPSSSDGGSSPRVGTRPKVAAGLLFLSGGGHRFDHHRHPLAAAGPSRRGRDPVRPVLSPGRPADWRVPSREWAIDPAAILERLLGSVHEALGEADPPGDRAEIGFVGVLGSVSRGLGIGGRVRGPRARGTATGARAQGIPISEGREATPDRRDRRDRRRPRRPSSTVRPRAWA